MNVDIEKKLSVRPAVAENFDYFAENWCARRDLNPQPSDPKSDALSN